MPELKKGEAPRYTGSLVVEAMQLRKDATLEERKALLEWLQVELELYVGGIVIKGSQSFVRVEHEEWILRLSNGLYVKCDAAMFAAQFAPLVTT